MSLAIATAGLESSAPSSIGKHYEVLREQARADIGLPDDKRAADLQKKYDELFAPLQVNTSLTDVGDDDLGLLFRGAYLAASDSFDARTIGDMASDLRELERRRKAAKVHYSQMYEMLVSARMFEAATQFRQQHATADLEALPEIEETAATGPSLLKVEPEKRAMLHEAFHFAHEQVLVVAHPLCHFSQNAVRDIEADSSLRQIFKDHAKWISPPYGGLQFNAFKDWNEQHTDAAMSVAYRRQDWPMIDTWETPTFYFLKDGAVVAKVTGWPKSGNGDAIRAALKKLTINE